MFWSLFTSNMLTLSIILETFFIFALSILQVSGSHLHKHKKWLWKMWQVWPEKFKNLCFLEELNIKFFFGKFDTYIYGCISLKLFSKTVFLAVFGKFPGNVGDRTQFWQIYRLPARNSTRTALHDRPVPCDFAKILTTYTIPRTSGGLFLSYQFLKSWQWRRFNTSTWN